MTASGNGLDKQLARSIELVVFDVDGVVTDAGVYIGATEGGEAVELKRFDIQDGLGHALLRESGIEVIWVTGRKSEGTALRGAELKVATVLQVPHGAKREHVEAVLAERGLGWEEMAFVGDDLADLPVLERVGLPIAVANAREEVKAVCRHVTRAAGGHGAVREVIDDLLKARGEWDEAKARYLATAGSQS
jgi:3-deoxy-D-manno-octulosonate 8-phosphate phosphatase (KDO 8-P phosphatase)